jgi:hypothetical protein
MAVKIPEAPTTRQPKRVMLRATLPSTAAMLSDLRSILVEQIHQHRLACVGEAPSVQSATVTARLMQAARELEAQTAIEQDKAQDLFEDSTPEEQLALVAEARKLLGSG